MLLRSCLFAGLLLPGAALANDTMAELKTGNNWGGPIKSFTLTVDKGDPRNLISFCGAGVTKTGPTTFRMKADDFYPEKDLEILIPQRTQEE